MLAGGKSSRMGQDKALLDMGGKTLLEWTVHLAREVARDVLIVTDKLDRYTCAGVDIVADVYPESGPVSGIITGMRLAGEGWHLVTACDMPWLKKEAVEYMMHQISGDVEVILPGSADEGEPLCALYSHHALQQIERYFAAGRRSARGMVKDLHTLYISREELCRVCHEPRLFRSVNEYSDWQEYTRG